MVLQLLLSLKLEIIWVWRIEFSFLLCYQLERQQLIYLDQWSTSLVMSTADLSAPPTESLLGSSTVNYWQVTFVGNCVNCERSLRLVWSTLQRICSELSRWKASMANSAIVSSKGCTCTCRLINFYVLVIFLNCLFQGGTICLQLISKIGVVCGNVNFGSSFLTESK